MKLQFCIIVCVYLLKYIIMIYVIAGRSQLDVTWIRGCAINYREFMINMVIEFNKTILNRNTKIGYYYIGYLISYTHFTLSILLYWGDHL